MDLSFFAHTPLFRHMELGDISSLLGCLRAREQAYSKGQIIYCAGDHVNAMGMVLSGSVRIQRDDFWGNTSILSTLQPGQLFAETYACVSQEPLMVSVVAEQPSCILFLETPLMLRMCSNSCGVHQQLVENLLIISAEKNLELSRKIACTTARTIRGRLLTYLSQQAARRQSPTFSVPFNRQQMADFLNVERSALSNELSKMQRDGLLRVKGRQITLLMEQSDAHS